MAKRRWTEKEIEEYRKKAKNIFYFNKEDSNIFVPKRYGFGVSFNWANPIAWFMILIIIVLIIYRVFF